MYVAGIDIHTSIAASVAAFFVSGLVGTVVYSQRGIIQWPDFVSVCVGAIPGALWVLMFYQNRVPFPYTFIAPSSHIIGS